MINIIKASLKTNVKYYKTDFNENGKMEISFGRILIRLIFIIIYALIIFSNYILYDSIININDMVIKILIIFTNIITFLFVLTFDFFILKGIKNESFPDFYQSQKLIQDLEIIKKKYLGIFGSYVHQKGSDKINISGTIVFKSNGVKIILANLDTVRIIRKKYKKELSNKISLYGKEFYFIAVMNNNNILAISKIIFLQHKGIISNYMEKNINGIMLGYTYSLPGRGDKNLESLMITARFNFIKENYPETDINFLISKMHFLGNFGFHEIDIIYGKDGQNYVLFEKTI